MTPLFVELCAGLASVSGCLQHGSGWKPPVSRMGRKTGYAAAILRVMGLRPGGKAERFLWAEADRDVAALLAAYTQPEKMREIAAIIRSWIPCPYGPHPEDLSCSRCKGTGRWDARDLWDVLRREERRGLWEGFDLESVAVFCSTSYLSRPGDIGSSFKHSAGGGWPDDPPDLERMPLATLPWPPVLIAQDAAVNVGSVAGWAAKTAWDLPDQNAFSAAAAGYGAPMPGREAWIGTPLEKTVARFSCHIWPPTALTPSASLPVPPLLAGTVVYIDPPYAGTTGYKHTFPRAEVIATAQRWALAGARVYISEAEPIPIPGWYHVEISGERKGQARTFSRSSAEWLTCSVQPAWKSPVQNSLFGGTS